MLMYDHNKGMHWCMFHEDENCMQCTAKICIHARRDINEIQE
jgi:hypothetical protein